MRLNGWQRLWVVTAGLWALVVVTTTWIAWPKSADVSDAEIHDVKPEDIPDATIRAQLTPVENAVLKDSELAIAKFGGEVVNPYAQPDLTSVPEPGQLTSSPAALLSVHEFAERVRTKYPAYGRNSDDVITGSVLQRYPAYKDLVDPQSLAVASQRFDDELRLQRRVFDLVRAIATRTLVRTKRVSVAGVAFVAWAIPAAVLYVFGWGIGWVRRGFTPGRS